jgi:hypothetical protein
MRADPPEVPTLLISIGAALRDGEHCGDEPLDVSFVHEGIGPRRPEGVAELWRVGWREGHDAALGYDARI